MNRNDFLDLFYKVVTPVEDKLSDHQDGLLKIGSTGTVYSEKIRQAEGFLRMLWGYAGYYKHQPVDHNFDCLVNGIIAGTDPDSPSYWGDIDDVNQLMVEMAPLAVFILMNEESVKEKMSTQQQQNVSQWLDQINYHVPAHNNWIFFRILTDVCLEKCFDISHKEQMRKDFADIDSFYISNGWYFDGTKAQIDYYISFAIHFYSLLYVYLNPEDVVRCRIIKERASKFSKTFRYWFDHEGRGIPFGRSLTYRFAQSAFWSAALLNEIEEIDLSEAKYYLEKNLQHWLSRDIFSTDGFLKIGYYYENLIMSEQYNGAGSPYWALKSFILLALPKDSPIWGLVPSECAKEPLLKIDEAKMLVSTNKNGNVVQVYPTGQFVESHTHGEAKYSKFVYSTQFGFCVPKGSFGWQKGGFDNVIAVSEQDDFFRVRTKAKCFSVNNDYTYTLWQPWDDVEIKSFVIPLGDWHIRIHQLKTQRRLRVTDGGFSVLLDGKDSINKEFTDSTGLINSRIGTSGAASLDQQMLTSISEVMPNQNLLYNAVVFPYLYCDLEAGQNKILCNAFFGSSEQNAPLTDVPVISMNADELIIDQFNIEKKIKLKEF